MGSIESYTLKNPYTLVYCLILIIFVYKSVYTSDSHEKEYNSNNIVFFKC